MEWIKDKKSISSVARVAIKSWCRDIEPEALKQASNLAAHPVVVQHVALMPDCHVGYGMPIGGVIACRNAVIPNAVGVDIGCGMGAVKTNLKSDDFSDKSSIRKILEEIKTNVPVGEGNCHKTQKNWIGFEKFEAEVSGIEPNWMSLDGSARDKKNLGTLGGGNHFIELQISESEEVWMMLHSGSRNLGYRIANFYHKLAQSLNLKWCADLPSEDLAFLRLDSQEGQDYVRDMMFALEYASENRRLMMKEFKRAILLHFPEARFTDEINIHHNYAALENHFGNNLWIHRKGATSAQKGQLGIIPGSMGSASYIVRGLGNPDSFCSCSHGAGRKMGRNEASRSLSLDECNEAMEGIVFDRWTKAKGIGKKRKAKGAEYDFGEAPQAYKDIEVVIKSELDLIEPLVKLRPLGVIKG
jgi:tRNA-splicing ligase RtcB